jgi:hypothetical protein
VIEVGILSKPIFPLKFNICKFAKSKITLGMLRIPQSSKLNILNGRNENDFGNENDSGNSSNEKEFKSNSFNFDSLDIDSGRLRI